MERSLGEKKIKLLPLNRLESLTDGIFAIAMTILVLGLPMPSAEHNVSSNSDLIGHLLGYSDLFWTYILSFLLLGKFWIIQQKIFRYLKITCVHHLWANLGGLLVVCLIPFSSELIGKHSGFLAANIFFHVNIFLIGMFFIFQCLMILKYPAILKDGVEEAEVRRIVKINMVLPGLALAGILVALFTPDWSAIVYIATPVLVRVVNHQTSRKAVA